VTLPNTPKGFTLVELLVAMTLLVLLIALVAQITSHVDSTITTTTKQIDITSQAGTALDRVGSNLGSMITARGVAPVVYKNTPDAGGNSGINNDGIAFVSNARPRSRSSVSTVPANFIRLAMIGYRVSARGDTALNNTSVPMLDWGDGTISFSTSTGLVQDASQAKSSLPTAIAAAGGDLSSGSQTMINFQAISAGIIRFELCFLLDDGTVVSTPPRDINFPAATFPTLTGNSYAVALSSLVSADANKRYVKAVIVGMAGLDSQTRQLVGTAGSDLYKLAEDLPDPVSTNQTPLQAWDFTSDTTAAKALRSKLGSYPRPVVQNLRLYQRYFYTTSAR